MLDYVQNGWRDLSAQGKSRLSASLFVSSLAILIGILYSPFLFGDHLFIFAGSASDSIGQTIPFILNEASRLSSGDYSEWNQYQFLGATTIQHFNPDYLPAIFGEQAVPAMMLVSQLAKIFFAGLFFYLFLGYFNLKYKTRYVTGLGFAFCGRMIELAPWTAYTIEITLFACLLWGFERFFSDRKKILVMPLSFALMGMSEGFYALVLYGFIMVGYAFFRSLYSSSEFSNKKEVGKFAAQFLALMCSGVLISLPVILPSIEMYSTSSRISSDVGNSGFAFLSILIPSNLTICAEEIVKFFSNAILGHMDSYTGSTCILNSPYFYAGLLPLIGIPFSFTRKTKKQKIALGAILFLCFFYCFSEGLRYILNGFSTPGDDFRQSSFWVVAVISLVGAIGLDGMWNRPAPKKLFMWFIALILIFSIAAFSIWGEISKLYFVISILLIILYFSLFLTSSATKSSALVSASVALIVLISPIEYIVQDFRAIEHAVSLTNEEYDSQLGNNPEEFITLMGNSDTDTQRIDYKTMMLTRSMADTYLGTQAYIGGAGMTQSVTNFVKTLDNDYIDQLGYSRYSYGFSNISTNTLLGVKYLVYPKADAPYYVPYGYREIGSNDKYTILKNDKALPLIFAYGENESMSTDSYLETDRSYRSEAMLHAVVLPDGNEASPKRQQATESLAKSKSIVTKDSPADLIIPSSNCKWIEASMSLCANASVSGSVTAKITFYDDNNNVACIVPIYTAAGNENIKVQVENKDIRKATVEFVTTNACDDPRIENINLSACLDNYYSEYDTDTDKRISKGATVHSYKNGCISADVDLSESGYLATTIPWSSNWSLSIDGEKVDTFPVNLGFVGCHIEAGKHSVELIYNSSAQNTGLFSSTVTLAVLALVTLTRPIKARIRKKAE